MGTSDVCMCTEGTEVRLQVVAYTPLGWHQEASLQQLIHEQIFFSEHCFVVFCDQAVEKQMEEINLGRHYSSLMKRSKVPSNHVLTVGVCDII